MKNDRQIGRAIVWSIMFISMVFILFSLITKNCHAQPECSKRSFKTGLGYYGLKHYDHSAGVVMQSVDRGFGVYGSNYFTKELGMYVSFVYGSYDVYGTPDEVPHYKFASGVQYRMDINSDVKIYMTAGASYHQFWGNERLDVYDGKINPEEKYYRLKHWSTEVGMGAEVRWFNCGIRLDFIRGEDDIYVGINF